MSFKAIWDVVRFQDEVDANFSMSSLSDEEVLKFQHCVDECMELMAAARASAVSSNNSFIVSWCNESSQLWFHDLYYELWRRSSDLNTLFRVVQPYCVPALLGLSMLQTAVLSLLLLCSVELRRASPLWLFVLSHSLLSGLRMVVASLLFSVLGKQFPKNNFFCRSQQFLTSTLSTVPNWILAETLFNQTLTALHRASLPPVGLIGTRIIIVFSVISIVVLNAHSLWLYSVDQIDRICSINSQAHVLVIGYPIYLQMMENLIPCTVIVVSVAILARCQCKKTREQDHQIRTSICLGVNFLLFNLSSIVHWFMTSFMKPNSSLKSFNHLKRNTLFVAISNILAEQSNFFILPILFVSSPLFRKQSLAQLGRIRKRVRDSMASKHVAIVMADRDLKDHSEIMLPLVRIEKCT